MPYKSLRIMIADSGHSQILIIERMLNQLGYYRVLPVQSLGDVRTLGQWLEHQFDVLIADARLIASAPWGAASASKTCSNVLLYNCQAVEEARSMMSPRGAIAYQSGCLDLASLNAYMISVLNQLSALDSS